MENKIERVMQVIERILLPFAGIGAFELIKYLLS